ncbi:MAG: hypothetical protein N2445_08505, partial [Acidobacteria bacterium]|nr:hypothetical protein [Acidobacteriota bacterium]
SGNAGGDPTFDQTLIALNTANELIEDLGKPIVSAGNCSRTTDWQTALRYFEEAEQRVSPTSPYNQAAEPNRNMYYLNALLAATIAETGYTLQNYHTLFETPETKPYRDTMLDWKIFADEQIARMHHLSQWALSEPNTPWEFQFPKFCIWLENTGANPFVNLISSSNIFSSFLKFSDPSMPASPLLEFANSLTPKNNSSRIEADEPVYTFEQSYWDRTDAYLLSALFHGWRAAAISYRVYENPGATRIVTAADLNDIQTWLEPEDDAEARAKCKTEPCPPLNGIDDDGDGLIDDLGYAARVFETFDGIGIYTPDAGNGCTLETAANDASLASYYLREGLKCVLKESDIQADDATLVYGDGGNHPPFFPDVKSYTGDPVPDGLPDLEYISGQFLPIGWCPPL